jgi:hypothetical protein
MALVALQIDGEYGGVKERALLGWPAVAAARAVRCRRRLFVTQPCLASTQTQPHDYWQPVLVVELAPLREAEGGLYTRVLAELVDSGQNYRLALAQGFAAVGVVIIS